MKNKRKKTNCEKILIKPDDKRRVWFSYVISIISIIDLFLNTYLVFLEREPGFINYAFLPFYVLEICLKFFTMYWSDVNLVKDPKVIALKYLKLNFWLDFIPSFPFFAFHKRLLFLKLIRIININTYMAYVGQLEEAILLKYFTMRKELIMTIQNATKFMLYLSYSIHWFVCLFIFIGDKGDNEGWIVRNDDLIHGRSIYIAALYFIVSTFATVGYGDITANTDGELLFNLVLELWGIGFFGYIIGNINSTIINTNSITVLKENEEEKVNIWLIRLQRTYRERIMNHEYYTYTSQFFNLLWDKDYSTVSKSEFFKKLKPQIQNELWDHIFKNIYEEFEFFFRDFELDFKRELVKEMKFQRFENFPLYNEKYKHDKHSITPIQPKLILQKGKIPFAVFFVTKGEAYASNSTGKYIYFKFPEKSFFGETHLIAGIPFSYSIFYNEQVGCSAYVITAKNFLRICQRYPHSFQLLLQRSIKRRRIFRQFKFAALNDLIQIALDKGSVAHDEIYREKEELYSTLNPKLVVNKNVYEHVANRITSLKYVKRLAEMKAINAK